MKKKVLFIFGIVFLIFLVLFLAILQLQVVQATMVSAEAIKGVGPWPPCPPGVNGRLDYTETDKKGNKVEVWCDGGQYRMKFTPAGGGGGYVGKCPFPFGQNSAVKKVNITINTTDNSAVVEEILKTFWISFDAPAPGVGVNGTNKPDRRWVYDSRTKKYIRQNTLHDGGWVTVGGSLKYNVTRVVPDGNATPPADAPANPNDLIVIGDPPPEEMVLCEVYTPEYELYTPAPVTFIEEYGNIETNVYKIPYGEELVVERIEAVENQPFIFDVEMPGEEAELVTYYLYGPDGMSINPVTGIIEWIPSPWQIGYNNVEVMIEYHGLSPDIDQFMLQVLSDYDGDGIPDRDDNCPDNYNPDQADMDNDGVGCACDNCHEVFNPSQADSNQNGIGDACEYISLNIHLNQNWNLISIPLALENNSIENIFSSIMNNVIVINGFESGIGGGARTYDPLLPEFSDLHNIDYLHGYWVKMSEPANLMIIGTSPENKTINLATNWNLISYLSDEQRSTSDVISAITSKVIVVNGFENGALTYDPLLPEFSDLQVMKPNFGYWIKMSASGVLNYAATFEETYTCCLNNFDATCFRATIEDCRAQNGAVMECVPGEDTSEGPPGIPVNYTKVNTTAQSGWLTNLTDAVNDTRPRTPYVPGTYDCDDFADDLERNLTALGYDATYTVYWCTPAVGPRYGHVVTDVHAPDGSLVFIEPQSGNIVDLDFDGDGVVEGRNHHPAGIENTDDNCAIEVYDSAAAAAAAGAPRD